MTDEVADADEVDTACQGVGVESEDVAPQKRPTMKLRDALAENVQHFYRRDESIRYLK